MITYLLGVAFTYGVVRGAGGVPARAAAGAGPAGADAGVPAVRRGGRAAGGGGRDRRGGGAAEPERDRRDHRGRARGAAGRRTSSRARAMRATVSADLLATIFSPYSPLHDGAVLVRGDEIVAAGCILPAHAESASATAPGHPPSRGAGAVRGDRRAGAGGLGGDARPSRPRARTRCSAASRPEQVRTAAGAASRRSGGRSGGDLRTAVRHIAAALVGVRRGPRRLRDHARARRSRSGMPASSSPPRKMLGIPHPPGTPLFVHDRARAGRCSCRSASSPSGPTC